MDAKTRQRFLDNWSDERNTASLYHLISELEKDKRIAEVYRRMEQIEKMIGGLEEILREIDAVAGLTEDGAGVCPDADHDNFVDC